MRDTEIHALSLAMQSGVPYVGLRDVAPDPNLMLYVPASVARAAEVVPLSLDENRLQLACATLEGDLTPIQARFPRLELELCISPADEIRDLLARMRGRES
ncbi:MAG TPA: hypothetical protein VGY32_02060 [Solirubrobacteraceae bacterium]|jgi:hypothetical protein|nr:hypothetical protein [Solirubrobacteraceae bacterium]